jgi:hypothetical protein
MAARTPVEILQHSIGANKLHIALFSDIDDDDTWISGIRSVIGYWAAGIDEPTRGDEGVIMRKTAETSSSGSTFAFSTGEDNRVVKAFVLSKT